MHHDNHFWARIEARVSIRSVLALMVIINGLWLVLPFLLKTLGAVGKDTADFVHWLQTLGFIQLLELPRFTLGACLIPLGVFLYRGARIAWLFCAFALFLLVILDLTLGSVFWWHGLYSFTLLCLLLRFWRRFSKQSVTNTAVVAVFSIVVLIVYSVLGALYLGDHFKPQIRDVFEALYFSVVSMTTVGYGDIVPVTVVSRTFTVSVVVFGITIFTTSVVYLVSVVVHDTREIVQKRLSHMKDHFVIVGSSPLARYVHKGLRQRDMKAVVVCAPDQRELYPADAVVVTGDISETETLNKASVHSAQCVMALTNSDIENTYILLATKEISKQEVKTVTIINDEQNRKKLELLHANYLFSLSELGSELLMKFLSDEPVDHDVIGQLLQSTAE